MSKISERLEKEYDDVKECLIHVNIGSDEYERLSKEADNIRNEIIKAEQIEMENKREMRKLLFLCISTAIGFAIQIKTINKSFKFDESATLTSTIGRSSVLDAATKPFTKIFKL